MLPNRVTVIHKHVVLQLSWVGEGVLLLEYLCSTQYISWYLVHRENYRSEIIFKCIMNGRPTCFEMFDSILGCRLTLSTLQVKITRRERG